MRLLFVLLTVSAMVSVGCSQAMEEPTTSSESKITADDRVSLMNALRAKVKPDLDNQDIVFDLSQGGSLREASGWAFLKGRVRLRSGGEPTTRGTIYEDADEEGLFDGFRFEALMHRVAGRWTVVESGIGSTDVWYAGIWDRYPDAPRSIFGGLADPDAETEE